ncbi:MAG: cytochrome c-type biogenesis protein [Yoonia sp.]|uniref:cytochrome c-type biogenesis protein n=1 Tax=Yoonia sp. TaxID=2212373 RepID=UPI003EF13801
MKRLVLILVFLASPLWAVEPSEMLDDPVLEERARDLSQGLRCPVCRNESIDESNAALSKELRIVLRERILAGDSDQEAVDFMVARYGEYVLLRPNTQGVNMILWLAAPALLLIALGIGWSTIRAKRTPPAGLSEAEKAELEKILRS